MDVREELISQFAQILQKMGGEGKIRMKKEKKNGSIMEGHKTQRKIIIKVISVRCGNENWNENSIKN